MVCTGHVHRVVSLPRCTGKAYTPREGGCTIPGREGAPYQEGREAPTQGGGIPLCAETPSLPKEKGSLSAQRLLASLRKEEKPL